MASTLLSARDLRFLLYEWLDVEALTRRPRYAAHSRETFDGALDLAERVATDHFAPHNRTNDTDEPRFDGTRVHVNPEVARALEVYAATGLASMATDASVGGDQIPRVVASACDAYFQAANPGTCAYPFLTSGNAALLMAHGSPAQIATFVRPMAEGRFTGTMCLSEPQAGSSLADITTRAEPAGDGTHRLFGNKMWISGGDHEMSENIVHLVLARIPGGPAGVKGISLFVVPKYLVNEDGTRGERNDVVPAGLNHKMGYRGTVNALLNFGEGAHTPGGAPGAVGHLVGAPHEGLRSMFHMMDGARVGVGAGAMAVGYTGYLKSLAYARERLQGRPLGAKNAEEPQVPIIEHTDVRRMLLAQKSYVEGALALVLYCARLMDERVSAASPERARDAGLLLEVLTPIVKSWPSQWCLEANSLAIQVHGGYGYTREYDVEQHYRDNRLNAIHEGTHGVQALDLLGRKVVLDGGARLTLLVDTARTTVARARELGGVEAEYAALLDAALTRTVEAAAAAWSEGDAAVALANATAFLEATGHVVSAWMWLEQVVAAHGGQGPFYEGKRAAAAYFFRHELPRTGPWFDLVASRDRTVLDVSPDVL
ncbi:acyl-CoA dehydrogenase [Nocardiopsis sp. MG754419]|uniref:acyl-CoA dehydrogenase n=1 Tax=Nocardiopsis sp. MG754419 TaxID=2259865 RepID=UPI001BAB34F1|nr:acyl-CoA dehydrogenase [Nocardiopsis sp. MG754419]MBR8743210.1 acyl-CoA dehydrogenase [Nocardiopsis sp. MG754419]